MGFLLVFALRDSAADRLHGAFVAFAVERLQRNGFRRVRDRRVRELLVQLGLQALPERIRFAELPAHAALRYGSIRESNRGWTDGSAGRGNVTRFIARSRVRRYTIALNPGVR